MVLPQTSPNKTYKVPVTNVGHRLALMAMILALFTTGMGSYFLIRGYMAQFWTHPDQEKFSHPHKRLSTRYYYYFSKRLHEVGTFWVDVEWSQLNVIDSKWVCVSHE